MIHLLCYWQGFALWIFWHFCLFGFIKMGSQHVNLAELELMALLSLLKSTGITDYATMPGPLIFFKIHSYFILITLWFIFNFGIFFLSICCFLSFKQWSIWSVRIQIYIFMKTVEQPTFILIWTLWLKPTSIQLSCAETGCCLQNPPNPPTGGARGGWAAEGFLGTEVALRWLEEDISPPTIFSTPTNRVAQKKYIVNIQVQRNTL